MTAKHHDVPCELPTRYLTLSQYDHPDVHHDHAHIRPADPENGGTPTGAAKRIANIGKLSDYSVTCYGAPVTPPQPTVLG
jgi:hypothetical protein